MRVVTLLDAEQSAGRHVVVWDGRGAAASLAASGVYFCRLDADGVVQAKEMLLLR